MPRVPLLYGPVPSRRLGYSLGIDLLPYKTCSMDCVYCQLGSSGRTVVRRREFVPASEVLAHVRQALESGRRIDAVTFSGSGEPTLHSGIRRIIRGIKRMTPVPVVVLTNASTLSTPDGRRALAEADIVVPSLDAANERVFAGVNRPHQSLTARKIIDGLAAFRKSYRGRIWLEIMLVKGMNDSPTHLRALKKAVERIRPDRIQLNTVVRPPAERTARPLSKAEMEKIKAFFGESAEVIASFKDAGQARGPADREAAVLATAGRRPVTAADLSRALGAPVPEIRALAERLARRGRLRKVRHGGRVYFEKGSETAYACTS
jgi:wyosine [tRNA(Phe)-imidazoG37] synthetase (radical SAM superfamily)